ncbi:MAG: hypothetical protein M3Y22_01515 [Pseudomonadota bacterium]|nr:hypothetical protein [Pseudomonadota bacterium]
MIPAWLHSLSVTWLLLGAACALVICIDVARHPQHMWIMNVVWPVTALFGTVWAKWQYFAYGRLAMHERTHAMQREEPMNNADAPARWATLWPNGWSSQCPRSPSLSDTGAGSGNAPSPQGHSVLRPRTCASAWKKDPV